MPKTLCKCGYQIDDSYGKKDYRLRVINEEKILNINFPFIAQDTLYMISKTQKEVDGFAIVFGNWKNRKKDGLWRFSIEKEEIYKEGKLIKVTYPNK